jgi:hypothetical protein
VGREQVPATGPAAQQHVGRPGPPTTSPAIEHDYAVGAPYGGQAVGDEEERALASEAFHRILDQLLRLAVDDAVCLVEDQDGRVPARRRGRGKGAGAAPSTSSRRAAGLGRVAAEAGADEAVRMGGAAPWPARCSSAHSARPYRMLSATVP